MTHRATTHDSCAGESSILNSLPAEDLEHVLDHTYEVWRELSDGRLFITGGTGFFGQWLIETLAWARKRLGARARATVLSRSPQKLQSRFGRYLEGGWLEGCIGDQGSFVPPAGRFTHMILAAGEYAPTVANAVEVAKHLRDWRHVLECARLGGASRVLIASSGAIYGPQPASLPNIDEEFSPINAPASGYAISKQLLESESILSFTTGGSAPLIARCFSFLGPAMPLDGPYAAGNFFADLLAGRPIEVESDGLAVRSYLYAADLAIWLWTILTRGVPGRPYNVGSSHEVSIGELAHQVSGLCTPALPVHIHRPPSGLAPQRYIPDISRARRELGLDVWISLAPALRRTYRWHLESRGA